MIEESLFSEKDFDNLMYQVYKLDNGTNLMARFGDMKKMPSWVDYQVSELNKNNVIRYIIYCYDRESPIMKKYRQDDAKRKTISAIQAGFKTDANGLFSEEVDAMMKCKNRHINLMIIDYVRQYNDPEYSILVAGHEALYLKLERLMEVENMADSNRDAFQIEETKGKLFKQAKEIGKDLSDLATKILTDDNIYIKRDLYCSIDEKTRNKLSITPERLIGIE